MFDPNALNRGKHDRSLESSIPKGEERKESEIERIREKQRESESKRGRGRVRERRKEEERDKPSQKYAQKTITIT